MHTMPTTPEASAIPSWPARCLSAIAALLRRVTARPREKSLRLCETLPLGDKRFLAIVAVEGRRFLIGATSQSIGLLDRLEPTPPPATRREPPPASQLSRGVH